MFCDMIYENAENDFVLKATRAIQMVVISRKIDYEKHRMPELKATFPDVKFVTWDLQMQAEPRAQDLDLQATIDANPSEDNLSQRIEDWERQYHADVTPRPGGRTTEGEFRLAHWNAIKAAKSAENRVVQGGC
jgi:hypothetical protein